MKDYAEKHGEIDSIEDEELARWIHFQKVWLKTDNPDKPEFFEKRKRLEEIGISRKRLDEDRFEKYYMIAMVYFQNHGNLLVPRQYKLSGYLLGEWICNLRNAYRSGERIDGVVLDTDKINRLNSIGMVWLSPSDWECMYEYAKAHYEKYGNLDMGINYSVRGLSLGKWVREQKRLLMDGTMVQDRKLLLEKIGMEE